MKKTAKATVIHQPRKEHFRSYPEMRKVMDAEEGEHPSERYPSGCRKWPLELVVRTAASLHKEGDNFAASAERAMHLIAECAALVEINVEDDTPAGAAAFGSLAFCC